MILVYFYSIPKLGQRSDDGSRHTLRVATGLRLSLYATGLRNPRFMARGPRGAVFVGPTVTRAVRRLRRTGSRACYG